MTYSTAALVGTTGGAGTTRLAVELGATLARDGRSVAVLDADFDAEGLARHVSGRIDPDVTTLLTEDRPLSAGLYDHEVTTDLDGRLALCPARAPFERMARAKTAESAQRFEALLDEASREFDHVLVDTPPIADNQAIAVVTTAERVGIVAPASERGVDAIQRTRGRIADVGAIADDVIANRAEEDHPVESADAAIPESEVRGVERVPASAPDPEVGVAPAIAHAAEVLFETELGLEFEDSGVLDELLPDALS